MRVHHDFAHEIVQARLTTSILPRVCRQHGVHVRKADLTSSRRHVYAALYGVAIVPLALLALAFVWILATGVQIPHFPTKAHALNERWRAYACYYSTSGANQQLVAPADASSKFNAATPLPLRLLTSSYPGRGLRHLYDMHQ